MDYSCGLGPHLGGSLRRGTNIRRSISSSKYIGGIDWHLRTQFLEQAKCLELKLDIDCTVLAELQDFYRRRAVVEQDYADALAKLANGVKQRHINETNKRPHWTKYTTTTIWNTLLGSTLRISEAHATLSDLFSKQMVQRLVDMDEDANRLHKQCREMMSACQNRVLADTAKLQAYQREYNNRQAATFEAERTRRRAEEKLLAAEQKARGKGKNPTTSQRYQRAHNEYASKQMAYMSTSVATARARNAYLIQLAATNHSVARYFTEEAPDIIDCLACGFHNSLARSAMMHLSCEEALKNCHASIVEMLNGNITALDWRQDKSLFLKKNEQSFSRPSPFVFVPSKEDSEFQIRADGVLRENLEKTAKKLMTEIDKLRTSTEETWKTLEEVEKKLLDLINQKDYDVSKLVSTEHPRRRRSLNTSSATNGTSNLASPGNQTGSLTTLNSNSSAQSVTTSVSGSAGQCNSPNLSTQSTNATTGAEQGSAVGTRTQPASGQITSSGPEEHTTGLYLSLRSAYRDARIAQEKVYLEGFAAYTQEMHQCQVMQVQLATIQHALSINSSALPGTPPQAASIGPTSGSNSVLRCGVSVLPRNTDSGTKSRSEPPQPHSADATPTRSARAADLSLAPPPPPPAPHCRLLTDSSLRLLNLSTSCSNGAMTLNSSDPGSLVHKPQSRRVLRVPNVGKPKLFGGTIDEYVEATKEAIPCVLLSCTRVIVQFGMHQQGIFRVSGSQTEINDFKAEFEAGKDPLVNVHEARDINSAAGLFKSYFRDLGEPPFPNSLFLSLIECTSDRSDVDQMARRLRQVVIQGLSRPVFVVMRFLFAFLNHVTEYVEENMMDAYNLAICFGPSLLPVPSNLNQVQYQANIIDLVKTFITHHAVIFDPMVPGPVYVKHPVPSSSSREPPTDSIRVATSQSSSYSPELEHKDGPLQMTSMNRMASEVAEAALRRYQLSEAKRAAEKRDSDASANTKSSSVGDLVDAETAPVQEDDNSGDEVNSISDSESSETPYILALALADFTGSSSRQLSFKKGDELFLYRRYDDHWWDGQLAADPTGTRGYVPHAYVIPKAALASLAELGTDAGVMDRSQYDGVGTEDDDDDEDDDVEEEIETKSNHAEPSVAPPIDDSTNSESSKPTEQDVANVSGLPDDTKPPADQSSPSKVLQNEEGATRSALSSSSTPTHSTVLVINSSNKKSQPTDSPDKGFPVHNNTTVANTQPTHSETVPVSPTESIHSEKDTTSPPVVLRTHKSPTTGAVESPQSIKLRHTVSYPLSSNLGAVPEDEAVSSSDYSYSSPVHRESSGETELHGRFTFASDIDSALAEVMRGLSSLEQADKKEDEFRTLERTRELSRKLQLPCAKHTPDLVMDLPVQTYPSDRTVSPTSSPASTKTRTTTLLDGSKSSADNFAEQGMDTMRKRPEPRPAIARISAFSRLEGLDSKPRIGESHIPNTTAISVKGTDEVKPDGSDQVSSKIENELQNVSVAACVAAVERGKPQGNTSSTCSVPRPPLPPKPKRN